MILDTNALSAFADGNSAIKSLLEGADVLLFPVIVIGEFRYGIEASRKKEAYIAWLSQFVLPRYVLAINNETALHYVDIRHELKRAGRPIPQNDLWIAALVREHDMPLLSKDLHFKEIPGVECVSW